MFSSTQRESRAHIRAQTTVAQPIHPQLLPHSSFGDRQTSFDSNGHTNNLPFAVDVSPPMSPQLHLINQTNSHSRHSSSHLQNSYQSSVQYQNPNDGLNSRIRTNNQSTTQSTPTFYSPGALNGASRRLHGTSRPESPVDLFGT